MELQDKLSELAELSCINVTERVIESEVVQLFREVGWPRLQIFQDVSLSDKAIDKADIVLKLDDRFSVLVEIKRKGKSQDAENQVRRYCSLLRPAPKLAILTDGQRWVLYYAGQTSIVRLLDASYQQMASQIEMIIASLNPQRLKVLHDDGLFEYLSIIDQAMQDFSDEARKRLEAHFAITVISRLAVNQAGAGWEQQAVQVKPKLIELNQSEAPASVSSEPT